MSLQTHAAITAVNARALLPERLPARMRISIDSRTIVPGETFLALRGPNFDGHRFVRAARDAGAAAVIVADPASVPDDLPALVVADTSLALQALAKAARTASGARIAAVTGSTGKTTTKALAEALVTRTVDARTVATPENENNEIGVAKLLLSLDETTRVAIVEMGCRHFGDIVPLVDMARPDFGVITNIGDAHLEIMGSRERLIETKFGIVAHGARAVLNARDADSVAFARAHGIAARWFAEVAPGEALPAVPGTLVATIGRSALSIVEFDVKRTAPIRCTLPGEHNLANLAAAVSIALALGADLDAVADAVPSLRLPPGRYERTRAGDVDVVFDAYNASMSGTLATLRAFANEPAARRIAVLGSMAELGDEAPAMHRRVGAAAAAAGVDAVLVGGDYANELAQGAREGGLDAERVVFFADNPHATAWLRAHARRGDVVLLKASRKYRLEEILAAMQAPA